MLGITTCFHTAFSLWWANSFNIAK